MKKQHLRIGRTIVFLLAMLVVMIGCSSDNGPAGPLPPDPPGNTGEDPTQEPEDFTEIEWNLEFRGAAPEDVDGVTMSPIYAARLIIKTDEKFDFSGEAKEAMQFNLKIMTNYEEEPEVVLSSQQFVTYRSMEEGDYFYISIGYQIYHFPVDVDNRGFKNHPPYTIKMEDFELTDAYWTNSKGEKIPFAAEQNPTFQDEMFY